MVCKKFYEISEKVIIKSLQKSDKNGENYLLTYKLCKNWHNIVGREIASILSIKSIQNNTLILKLVNASYSVEAQTYRDLIRERMNIYLGTNLITDILIRN